MAKLPNYSLLSGARGRIGDLVVYTSNGIQIVRALPKRNKDRKPSSLQQSHLESFKAQHVFARSIKTNIIDRIWSHMPIPAGMNPYNYFIKSNSDAFGKSDHIKFPQLMTLSAGNLLPAEHLKVHVEDNILILNWTFAENNAFEDTGDLLNIVILTNKKELQVFGTRFTRSDTHAELELAGTGSEIQEGFIFWASAEDNDFSRSEYWEIRN